MKMLFISNNWADAHQQTRLRGLVQAGFVITCLAVYRNTIPFNHLSHRLSLAESTMLTTQNDSEYTCGFLFNYGKNAPYNDYIYVYGFDLALTTLIYKTISRQKTTVIYEIPDIREIFFSNNFAGKLIRKIEKIIIPHIDQLVVTSPDFISEYFTRLRKIHIKNYLVIENKIHSDQLPKDSSTHPLIDLNRKIRIGYFGVLRCPSSLSCLISLAIKNQFEIIMRGIFMPETSHFEEKIRKSGNIFYHGSYQVPGSLEAVYSEADIIWAAYPFSKNETGNHRYARTNRFYESLFFKKNR